MTLHFDIVCPLCGTRMGGCRCPSPDKIKRTNPRPCQRCIQRLADGERVETTPLLPGMVTFSVIKHDPVPETVPLDQVAFMNWLEGR